MAGTFIAFDLILFVFWELVLVPMYFPIGIWGSRTVSTRRSSSSSTRCSDRCSCCSDSSRCSTPTSAAGAYVRHHRPAGVRASGGFSNGFQSIVFAAVGLGFAVQGADVAVPHVAPRRPYRGADDRFGAAMGIMLKMGAYGFIRIALPILPYGAQKYAPWIGLLAAIAIVQRGARVPSPEGPEAPDRVQLGRTHGIRDARDRDAHLDRDQRRDLGMVAHGLITGMLFFCVGSLYDRYHTRGSPRSAAV